MNLKKYDAINTVSAGRSKMTVSFNRNGVISLSGLVVEILGLSKGVAKAVHLYRDEESPGDWYVGAASEKDGLLLRKNAGRGAIGYCFNSTTIARMVLEDLDWSEKGAAICRVVPNPVEVEGIGWLFPILISSARKPEL
ncbi:hypothetical protein HF324_18515 [Chitinophaga oryzae]|uniref:Uncharacterized protein n=1 Tax=Chitinophaga oryzae TaxID=2725414 RepID=A0ABX6LLN0_9BACT|nr:hypothetical protein [Chitinophaga oryzae]QJB39743.1 hypothetical protein HF324_18515 [Chitinophaga oryzae]